uniref:Tyrosine-protein kinase ephrin type A/B receptor-like domain-containing protein n=1 Tax=Chromera velia CCMP2878 TaxID=1169474 RepID=A0A0G4HA40_9ALVE|eukprot:Cvel_6056.t1-p1 / transcript=Cvel_6056.t1 / gene=Cvel_6056 / organism=Chromera_velia_CCMP2878 / gene_product=hypothetical protein / transcript_product=hypothetical protein / location=Cvel_scaffold291:47723-62538(-) / protein_length=745 / sequence_SO=supercontig / SO=protein_coding / is_pseudo=false
MARGLTVSLLLGLSAVRLALSADITIGIAGPRTGGDTIVLGETVDTGCDQWVANAATSVFVETSRPALVVGPACSGGTTGANTVVLLGDYGTLQLSIWCSAYKRGYYGGDMMYLMTSWVSTDFISSGASNTDCSASEIIAGASNAFGVEGPIWPISSSSAYSTAMSNGKTPAEGLAALYYDAMWDSFFAIHNFMQNPTTWTANGLASSDTVVWQNSITMVDGQTHYPPGGQTATFADAPVSCPTGTQRNALLSCEACSTGYYNNVTDGTCTACATGTYANGNGTTDCSTCAAGTFTSTTGALENRCITCSESFSGMKCVGGSAIPEIAEGFWAEVLTTEQAASFENPKVYVCNCVSVLMAFDCRLNPSGEKNLRAYPTVFCNTEDHNPFIALGSVCIVMYIVCGMCFVATVLFMAPKWQERYPAFRTRLNNILDLVQTTAFLYICYVGVAYTEDTDRSGVVLSAAAGLFAGAGMLLGLYVITVGAVEIIWKERTKRKEYLAMLRVSGNTLRACNLLVREAQQVAKAIEEGSTEELPFEYRFAVLSAEDIQTAEDFYELAMQELIFSQTVTPYQHHSSRLKFTRWSKISLMGMAYSKRWSMRGSLQQRVSLQNPRQSRLSIKDNTTPPNQRRSINFAGTTRTKTTDQLLNFHDFAPEGHGEGKEGFEGVKGKGDGVPAEEDDGDPQSRGVDMEGDEEEVDFSDDSAFEVASENEEERPGGREEGGKEAFEGSDFEIASENDNRVEY